MAKTTNKRKENNVATIKRRLSAALVMLLISTVMLVTATYAWFTLSTAPEVKGIGTNVAGNGSLEVALLPGDGLLGSITSGRAGTNGGGSVAVTTANNTWGNVVTLSDDSYGFGSLELRPAQMTIVDAANATQEKPAGSIDFAIPDFGYDGRIKALVSDDVSLNAFDTSTNAFTKTTAEKGVRAIVITGEDTNGDPVVTTYGYVVDLAFRINTLKDDGNNAQLRLQQQGIQRVYNGSDEYESSAANTQGEGSYLRFENKPADSTLTDSIKIAFIQNYGIAGQVPTVLAYGVITDGNGTLKLVDDQGQDITDNVLIDGMLKNTAYQVSVVVWLDGANVTNADFAATADALTSATLNLQFTTDADLIPALNTDLRDNPPAAVVDRTALNTAITTAQGLVEAAADPSAEAVTTLSAAITAAQGVSANADQATVNAAAATLNAAIAAYNATLNP